MKKLLKISFLLAILCFTVPTFADDGDLPIGTKTCTQNCGLYDGTILNPTNPDKQNQDESTLDEIYSWIYKQISEIAG